jgi:hypothetical protein
VIALALTQLKESVGPHTAFDVRGLGLVTGAALGIVWGLVRGNSAGWGSLEVVATLTLGVLLTPAFVLWELRAREPMLPMRLFGSRAFSAGNTAIVFLWGSAFGAAFFMAQFLQNGLHYGPLAAGLRLMPWGATTILVPQIAGALIPRFSERPFIVAGMTVQAGCMAWIALIADPHLAYWEMVAPLILAGAGVAMAVPATQSSVRRAVDAPVATGVVAVADWVSGSLAGGDNQRRGASEAPEPAPGEPSGVANLDQQLRDRASREPAQLAQRRAAGLHEPLELAADRSFLRVELGDLGAVALQQREPQHGRAVIPPAAIDAHERPEPRSDRFGDRQLLAQLQG